MTQAKVPIGLGQFFKFLSKGTKSNNIFVLKEENSNQQA